ncbi:hypothetical protein VIGAN_07126800 [Vigna angularis var. angularis]|uniref:Uncharacterized protein n=1 Tax=Vigna angularis var. angularis TaxID=157739 RepID=A0A0S3SIA2_PHAAN|nr:hypothetical protein VIGAN_07126800 [Vigna angularis var. angularis]
MSLNQGFSSWSWGSCRGKQVWGCLNYKRTRNEELQGCNFFKWRNEDNIDDAGSTIARQRRKINSMEKSVMGFQKRKKMFIWMLYFMGLINIILLCISLKVHDVF